MGCVPPVTRMTLPSRLPMSFSGSNFLPMPMPAIESFNSGIVKPAPSSTAVTWTSKNWRRMREMDSKIEGFRVERGDEVVAIAENCDSVFGLPPLVFCP
jgi:hypothetical protein